jgi:transaldolase
MTLLLDSAQTNEIQTAMQWGWVSGVTTNPKLLAQCDTTPEETLKQIANLVSGEIFYQLTSPTLVTMLQEANLVYNLIGKKIVLKIPATPLGFQALSQLSSQMNCSITAIYHPAQAVVAAQAGAKYAIAYVNRATRLLGDGFALVRAMSEVLQDSSTEILAASIKSTDEAVATIQAGARHLSLPFKVLEAMPFHELSQQALEDFNLNGRGLSLPD